MEKIIIAIDGFSSCGKSTLAKSLSKALGYAYIDTGAMYRAVTYYFLHNSIEIEDTKAVEEALLKITIHFENDGSGNRTFLNNVDIEDEIRKMYISEFVSQVAAISSVRRSMVRQQQAMGQKKGIVMDGRDIGTVVFEDAELKIFLTAEPDIRAQRRLDELKAKGHDVDFERVKTNLLNRDRIDSTRDDSPLKKAEDAIVIDNSHLTQNEQLDLAIELANQIILHQGLLE